jgi:uncharacterized membrane protein YoaK (UPF0700 family)
MSTFFAEVRETLAPRDDTRHGPLPPLLIVMTVVTGLVDAFSYLALGRIFVANMTGNVVLLGFALAGAPGFSIAAATQTLLRLVAALLALLARDPIPAPQSYALICLPGAAMGLQNATVRKLAVPDLTTTVLTLTLVAVSADSQLAGGRGSRAGRRLVAVAAMLLGALIGALLLLHGMVALPLVIAALLVGGGAITTHVLSRTDPSWVHASAPDETDSATGKGRPAGA